MLSLQREARPAGLQAPPSPAGLRLSPLEALAERELPAAVSWGAREWGGGEHSFQVRGSGTAAACHVFAVCSCQPLGGAGDSGAGLLAEWLLMS